MVMFTREQEQAVFDAAMRVPERFRERFIAACIDALFQRPTIETQQIIVTVAHKFSVNLEDGVLL